MAMSDFADIMLTKKDQIFTSKISAIKQIHPPHKLRQNLYTFVRALLRCRFYGCYVQREMLVVALGNYVITCHVHSFIYFYSKLWPLQALVFYN